MEIVKYPTMRREVMQALACLADPAYQMRVWVNREYPTPSYYDDLTMNVHALYDDNQVLPTPESRVGTVLVDGSEVVRLRELGELLDRLIDRHGEAPDVAYVADPEWGDVVRSAAGCLAAMVRSWGLN